MVENDSLVFTEKLKNALKHSVCRKFLKLTNTQFQKDETIVSLSTPKGKLKVSLDKEYTPSLAVHAILNHPEITPYGKINVVDVDKTGLDFLKNFSSQNLSNSFILYKVPKKQLQIGTSDTKYYVDICMQSYQKVINKLDSLEEWSGQLSFEDLVACLRRKEIVTILILLSQSN